MICGVIKSNSFRNSGKVKVLLYVYTVCGHDQFWCKMSD